ncbi:MAG: hypothetical protein HDS02_00420 [Bacteroides sp.]|nr:hypothetical protein [Bacteroides sp.]
MTIVDIKALLTSNKSYLYNRKMAKALYCSMWLENWGSGAKRIIEACQEQGVEEPTWVGTAPSSMSPTSDHHTSQRKSPKFAPSYTACSSNGRSKLFNKGIN